MNAAWIVVTVGLAGAAGDKVEEVNLDDLDEPAHDAKPKVAPAAGSTTIEEVKPEELAQRVPIPEYDTSPWLIIGPILALLLVMWNVDWKDARVKQEWIASRQQRAPKVKAPAPKETA